MADLPRLGLPRPKGDGTTWGLGDIVTQFFFAPKTKGGWKFGLGPQLSWKTRTDNRVGGPGWGAGSSCLDNKERKRRGDSVIKNGTDAGFHQWAQ